MQHVQIGSIGFRGSGLGLAGRTIGLRQQLLVQHIQVGGLGRALARQRQPPVRHVVTLRRQALPHLQRRGQPRINVAHIAACNMGDTLHILIWNTLAEALATALDLRHIWSIPEVCQKHISMSSFQLCDPIEVMAQMKPTGLCIAAKRMQSMGTLLPDTHTVPEYTTCVPAVRAA